MTIKITVFSRGPDAVVLPAEPQFIIIEPPTAGLQSRVGQSSRREGATFRPKAARLL